MAPSSEILCFIGILLQKLFLFALYFPIANEFVSLLKAGAPSCPLCDLLNIEHVVASQEMFND